MAGLQQVLNALVAEARTAIADLDHPATVYAGWPTQQNLAEVVAKGIRSHVSVYALPGERNTTRAIVHVAKVGGQDEATPQTKLQLEALAQKHGDEALDEIAAAYLDHFVAGSPGLRPL